MRPVFLLWFCFFSFSGISQDSIQAQLLGKYKFPEGSIVAEAIVVFENGALMMNSSQGSSVLELIKGDSFNIVNFNGIAVFKRNEARKIIGVHVDAGGYLLDGVKDPAPAGLDLTGSLFAIVQKKQWSVVREDPSIGILFRHCPLQPV